MTGAVSERGLNQREREHASNKRAALGAAVRILPSTEAITDATLDGYVGAVGLLADALLAWLEGES